MMNNRSAVMNYKAHQLFVSTDDPDAGYVQLTRSGEWVYLTVDGKSVGVIPASEFDRVASVVAV